MKKKLSKKNTPQIITIFVNLILFIAVFFLMNYVQGLLKSDSEITLSEVVMQNKDVITSKLNAEMSGIDNVASSLTNNIKGKTITTEMLHDELGQILDNDEKLKYFVATSEGDSLIDGYDPFSIAGRSYFKIAMQGYKNISDKLIARTSGDDVFIISVPLKVDEKIIGSVQKFYSVSDMYKLCSLSLFSSKGTMNIINKDGYLMLSSQADTFDTEKDNYFRSLYINGNEKVATELEKDIKQNKNGSMEITVNNETSFMCYTPIEGIHDWYLVTSVAKSAVSPNGSIVIRMFYIILIAIVLVFGASMFYFIYYKNKQQSTLENLAFVDNITEGNTYTKFVVDFHERMLHSLNDTYYLMKLDIDNFKYVNNYYGFEFGDYILKKIYKKIESNLNEDETMCRSNADHFILLLKNDISNVRLQNMLSSVQNKENYQVYYSTGLYKICDRKESLSLMIDKASVASLSVKNSLIKKIEIYSEEFDKQLIHNEQMKRSVKEAIQLKEIRPYYQPKVDINTNRIVGGEALARWINAEGKMIYPDEFIPLCEKSGLIVELDFHIFECVLQYLKERLDMNLACVPISVNFSRNHLMDVDFVSKVTERIKSYQVPEELLEIEITESAFFNNLSNVNHVIKDLHKQGFKVSMDDFGSGYSSLNMLKDVTIDVLKIDREFLMGTENSERQKIIFSAIARMANELHIKVVVEGVETIENIELMREHGCTIAQGYYFAKPMPQSDFDVFIKENEKYEEDNL